MKVTLVEVGLQALLLILSTSISSADDLEPFEPRPPGTEIEFPFYRYRLWNDLTNTILDAAEGMGYNQPLWENPGTAGVEFFSWYALSDADKEFAATIGFEEFGWDCHMNHCKHIIIDSYLYR